MWKIDGDYIAEQGDITRIGVSGETNKHTWYPRVRFRLLDGDGEVYYGGWLNDDPECYNQNSALGFGALDAGCTEIQVKRNGEWVTEIG